MKSESLVTSQYKQAMEGVYPRKKWKSMKLCNYSYEVGAFK